MIFKLLVFGAYNLCVTSRTTKFKQQRRNQFEVQTTMHESITNYTPTDTLGPFLVVHNLCYAITMKVPKEHTI